MMFSRIFDDAADTRARTVGMYAVLIAFNVGAWLWAMVEFHASPVLLGTAFLAYSFGLRHAFDPDHIAAIDNVTRKLIQEGQKPVAVGFFFSIGHSTIVVALVLAITLTTTALQQWFETFKNVGNLIGTSVSASFLLTIAAANIVVLVQVYRAFRTVKSGGQLEEDDVDMLLAKCGFFNRLFRSFFKLIERSWHMYPLGVLFGLGFDTATEVGLLGISATQASQGMSLWPILVFPALFAAGMSLMDTTDSTLMVGAYGWAFIRPIRKLYYNMTITLVSIIAALVIGGLEALNLIGGAFRLGGSFWSFIGLLNDDFGWVGYGIVAFFIASWIVSFLVYKARGYDSIEVVS